MGRHFTTVRELIYWEYATIIAGKAVGDRHNCKFVKCTFRKLMNCKVTPTSILAEKQQKCLSGETCAYCGASQQLQWEHILPLSLGGPDSIDNMVRACPQCNQAKGARDPYQWLLGDKPIPRMVLGKFLKVVYEKYERENLLDSEDYMKSHAIERITLGSIFSATRRTRA
jgi:hypothetical protein